MQDSLVFLFLGVGRLREDQLKYVESRENVFFYDMGPLKQQNIKELPVSYRGLFKVWSFLKKKRLGHHSSVYWLLQEPVVCGTCFSPGCQVGLTMHRQFCLSNVVTLRHVVQLAGANMDNVTPLACCLQVKSTRTAAVLLSRWREALTDSERALLRQYCDSFIKPDENVFPSVSIFPDFRDCIGSLLNSGSPSELSFRMQIEN